MKQKRREHELRKISNKILEENISSSKETHGTEDEGKMTCPERYLYESTKQQGGGKGCKQAKSKRFAAKE